MTVSVFTRYALRSLAGRRVRTCVTVAGAALACALVTAVFALTSSLSAGIIEAEAESEGAWQLKLSEVSEGQLETLADELAAAGADDAPLATQRDLGAAVLEGAPVPLLNVMTVPEGTEGLVVLPELAGGRWPEAAGEIVLPASLAETWPVGSVVELALGRRRARLPDGTTRDLDHGDSPAYELGADGSPQLAETLADVGEARAYTVVGLLANGGDDAYVSAEEPCAGPEELVYAWAAPGTLNEDELAALGERVCASGGWPGTHDRLLELQGLTESSSVDVALSGFTAAASALVSLVAVALVSGTFRVSVAERTRQLGLLASVGASRHQLVRVVLTEAALVGALAIPAGLALGLGHAAAVLALAADGTALVTGGVSPGLSVGPATVLAPVAVTGATLLASALVPAVRAGRVSPAEALRAPEDAGRRRTRRAPRTGAGGPSPAARLLGLPGLLAVRSRQARRSRGRATSLALALSTALVVTSGLLGQWLAQANVGFEVPADLSFSVYPSGALVSSGAGQLFPSLDALLGRMSAVDGMREVGYVAQVQGLASFQEDALEPWARDELWFPSSGDGRPFATVYYLDDATWERLCAELGVGADPAGCVAVNRVREADRAGELPLTEAFLGTQVSAGETDVELTVRALMDEAPAWLWISEARLTISVPTFLAPASAVRELTWNEVGSPLVSVYATADDSASALEASLVLAAADPNLIADNATDEREAARRQEVYEVALQGLVTGFGTVAALVAAGSAFNATAAAVELRTRELAVLRSLGMGRRDLWRTVALEGTADAIFGLVGGLVLALGAGTCLHLLFFSGRGVTLDVPWGHVACSCALVAAVVVASSAYALRRLIALPLLDALRADVA